MMDKYCEFCVNLRSVVYCKADAAYLCLSCDTKVHSANPLSNRHYRTLICDFCRRRPTYIRCYDHQKFMCRGCDHTQHNTSSQHRKRVMNSYMGCPSARDLGLLWGFDMNQFIDCSTSTVVDLENNVHIKEMYGGMQAFSVLQQLVDLLKVQTSEVDHILRCQEPKVENEFDQFSQQFLIGGGCPDHYDISLDPCSSPFTQLDHLESSSQLWSQNMQDLGVCEEPSCVDDLNIPDIDLTFRNFEELFRIEQEPKRVDQVNALVETFSNHPKNTYERDTCMDTSVFNTESSPKKARYTSQTMSFSHSRLSVESSGTVCFDSSTSIEYHEPVKAKGKKSVQPKDTKQGRCGYRKARSDTRKRTKSQSWKFESHESVTRSC